MLAYTAFLIAWNAYRTRDEVDEALAADDQLGRMLRAWQADVDAEQIR